MKRINIFEKKELRLIKEDSNVNDVTVDVDSSNSNEIASNLNKSGVTGVTAPTTSSTENNEILVQVPTKPTGADVEMATREADKQFKSVKDADTEYKYVEGGVSNKSRRLRENAVRFSKKELTNFLRSI